MTMLPHTEFDTATFAVEDRLDAVVDLWRNYLSFKFDPGRNDFFLNTNVWWISDCALVHSLAAPMTCLRPPPPDEEALISISFLRCGTQDYFAGDALRRQTPDAVHVSSHRDQMLRRCHTDSEIIILYVPNSRLGLFPGEPLPIRIFPIATPVGAVLLSMLLRLRETLDECMLEDGGMLADGICAFLEPVLRDVADLNAAAASEMRRAAIQRYIEMNINNPSLDPSLLCERFGVSRASLYRLFDEADGVKAYIARRRTQLAMAELCRSPARRGNVRSVAEKFGFHDRRQFNRAFRKFTGTTPISVIGSSISGAPDFHSATNLPVRRGRRRPLILSSASQSVPR
ncbi:helix-turn-helix domain-containing protein [uncultured Tateyamaria sp.]|uniref:helix-turn-helix domain-containing protein n=1 Tax=uncultured Tateyamaria sp. TaxID=455651 RepID=UPI002637329D|nr:helix-turn-helix domain-containing protein [uncultured Tateyamaria sp.]